MDVDSDIAPAGDREEVAGRRRVRKRVLAETALAVTGSTGACYVAYLAIGLRMPGTGTGGLVMMLAPVVTPLLVAPIVAVPFARASERVRQLLVEVRQTRRELAREVADRAAVQERLEQLVRQDPLTGLLNRRGFFELWATPPAEDFELLVLDVDEFKSVNDAWGHAAGDAVLRVVASVLSETREGTEVARLGGDEFAVVSRADGRGELESIAVRLESLVVKLPDGSDASVSCSVGRAPLRKGASVDAALAEADDNMYEVKRRRAVAGVDGPVEPTARERVTD